MKPLFFSSVLGLLLVSGAWLTHASDATALIGSWRSGGFQYTFRGDGTYVYVGAMGTNTMQTRISEQGTYTVSGSLLLITRQSGIITNTNNYRQDLKPQTTPIQWGFVNTQAGLALNLVIPNGQGQLFYRQ
jgi:hypothetical protein